MTSSQKKALGQVLMALQWDSAFSLIVAGWLTDQAATSLHYGLLPSTTETGD